VRLETVGHTPRECAMTVLQALIDGDRLSA
jgi:hypothetical protein